MAVRVIFRCEHCPAQPDPDTHRVLTGQLHARSYGEYVDAQPGGWLIWTAGGPLGPRRYACPEHRGDLTAELRRHYRAIHSGVRRRGPYRELWPNGFSALDEQELAELLSS